MFILLLCLLQSIPTLIHYYLLLVVLPQVLVLHHVVLAEAEKGSEFRLDSVLLLLLGEPLLLQLLLMIIGLMSLTHPMMLLLVALTSYQAEPLVCNHMLHLTKSLTL